MDSIYDELALLYLKNKDLSALSPSELYDEYRKALNEICEEAKKYNKGTTVLK